MENENYFSHLNKIQGEISKKQNLSYISWATAWEMIKKEYPQSNYTVYEDEQGYPFWSSNFGVDVKVGVTVESVEHIVRLPVMDGANKAMKKQAYTYKTYKGEKEVQPATMFDINKAIQRALTKALAMHGVGLYVYKGEDLPEIDWKLELSQCKTLDELKDVFTKCPQTKDLVIIKDELKETLITKTTNKDVK